MSLHVTEAGREFTLCDAAVSTSVVSHSYLLLFYNMFQSLSFQFPWLLHETRSKGTLRTYRHQAKCSPEAYSPANKDEAWMCWNSLTLWRRGSRRRGFDCCGGGEGLPHGFIGLSTSGSGCQVAICFEATCCDNCILCVHHLHQRPDTLRVSKCLQLPFLQNVMAPVTSKLSWAIDRRMSLLLFCSHSGLRLHSRLLY